MGARKYAHSARWRPRPWAPGGHGVSRPVRSAEHAQPSKSDVVASFVGMAPIEDPRIVVAVVLDAPRTDASGGSGAAPVFAEVMRAALHQLGIPPDGD